MTPASFTLFEDGRAESVDAHIGDGRVRIAAASLEQTLGWTLKPEGLCRGEVCVPVPEPDNLADGDGIDLARFAELVDRPLALDLDEHAAALGSSAVERGSQLATLEAPDFTLPDLDGRAHSLSEHRGKKVLLIAYASW